MPEEQNPSSSGGATPATGSPATGTPASSGATPQPKPTLTLEEALKRITDLEQHASNKTEEAARHGNRLTATEKELAAYKAAEQAAKDAQLSEVERVNKQYAELQEQHEAIASELFEARVFQDVVRHAEKFNFNVSAETLSRMLLLDEDAIEFENGKPTNIEKLLEKLTKSEPGLVKQQPGTPGTPALPAMNPGRSSITQPGGNVPGRIPRLDDIPWKR